MRRILLLALVCLGSVGLSEPAPDNSAAAALAKLASLAGEWEGPFEWTGARTGTGRMNVAYSVTGYGSAVVENLAVGGVPSMMSVYHIDGADLRMTHYCGARNQPRLKARRIDLASGAVDFAFVDITNVRSADDPHVYGVEIRFRDTDHFTLTFLFEGSGKKSREQIDLTRVAARTNAS